MCRPRCSAALSLFVRHSAKFLATLVGLLTGSMTHHEHLQATEPEVALINLLVLSAFQRSMPFL